MSFYQDRTLHYVYTGFEGFSDEFTHGAYQFCTQTNTPLFGRLEAFRIQNARMLEREPQMFMTKLIKILKQQWVTEPELQYHEIAYELMKTWALK